MFKTNECCLESCNDGILSRRRQLVVITPVSWWPHCLSTLSDTVKFVGFPNIHSPQCGPHLMFLHSEGANVVGREVKKQFSSSAYAVSTLGWWIYN